MKCLARNCKTIRGNGKKFHRLPTNKEKAKKWLKLINRAELIPLLNDKKPRIHERVCEKHFSKWNYVDAHSKYLKPDAMPKLNSTGNKKPFKPAIVQSDCTVEQDSETTGRVEAPSGDEGFLELLKSKRMEPPSIKQKDFLLDYIERNRHLASSRLDSQLVRKEKWMQWKVLSGQLNALEGTKKNSSQWKRYWVDLVSRTKTKFHSKKCKYSGDNTLTEHELKVLSILNVNVARGKKKQSQHYVSSENKKKQTASSKLKTKHNFFMKEGSKHISVLQKSDNSKKFVGRDSIKSAKYVTVPSSLNLLENENKQTSSSELRIKHYGFSTYKMIDLTEESEDITKFKNGDIDKNFIGKEHIESTEHVTVSQSIEPPSAKSKKRKRRKVLRSSDKIVYSDSIMEMEKEALQLKKQEMESKQEEMELKKRKLKILEHMMTVEARNSSLCEKILLKLTE